MVAVVVATFGLDVCAWADEASEARAGQDLAAKVCSPCHAVAETPGPPFAEIARGERAAPEALRGFLHATHSNMSHPGAMPNPELTDSQIEEISAYLAALREAK
jgi:mono/diheme cytochrome c family protein